MVSNSSPEQTESPERDGGGFRGKAHRARLRLFAWVADSRRRLHDLEDEQRQHGRTER
jgi:hypothetical protein